MNQPFSLRSQLRVARESDTLAQSDIPAGDIAVAPEQVDVVLAEPVSAEIAEVAAGVDAVHNESGLLEETAAEADAQAQAAEDLTAAAEGDGIDETGVKLAVAALESCRRNYATGNGFQIARESLNTRDGAKGVALRLAREADGNSKTLWQRVVQAAEDLWNWIKNFVAGLLDKRKRLLTKAEAIKVKAEGLKKAGATAGDAKIKISGNAGVVGGKQTADGAAVCEATASLMEGFELIALLAAGSFGTDVTNQQASDAIKAKGEVTDLNPKGVGNAKLTVKFADKRADVELAVGDAPAEIEVAAQSLDEVVKTADAAKKAIVGLQAAEKAVKEAEKQVGGTLGKLKALASGKETDVQNQNGNTTKVQVQQDRGAILSRLRAVSSIGGKLSSLTLSAVDSALTTAGKSLAAYKAPAAAAK